MNRIDRLQDSMMERERERERILESDGDFRSEECIEYLKQANIVVTNPPFSLFREYIAQLIDFRKQFIILGNMNATATKDIFPLFQSNKCWFGIKTNGSFRFTVPEHYPLTGSQAGIDEEGKRYVTVPAICWYTNLEHEHRRQKLILYEEFTPTKYPKFDNYNAIEVSKTVEIPKDFDGIMGVPISFLAKYNPEQFEILGMDMWTKEPIRTKVYLETSLKYLNGASVLKKSNSQYEKKYKRVFIRRKS